MNTSLASEPVLPRLASASKSVGLDPLASRFDALRRWLSDDLVELEQAIAGLQGPSHVATAAARHLLARPGKRIRPLCVLLAARLGGRDFDEPVKKAAVAAELVHAATLLHDDVIDDGTERRGAPASRIIYGNAASVLGGDYLLTAALRLVREVERPELMGSLLDAIAAMVDAEALQLERRGTFSPNREIYLQVARGKTAALFGWALEAGATLGDLPVPVRGALREAGVALGLAFQLVDDVLDLAGDPDLLGKNLGADVREGKLTWPLILAAERDPGVVDLLVAGQDPTVRVLATGAIEDSRTFAAEQIARADELLRLAPAGPARVALATVGAALVERMK